jgi:hypothetical protein
MKMSKETMLFRVLTGSRLYGTDTPASDFDYKAVCLPGLDELLLNTKLVNRKEKPEGVGAGDKMLAGETESEYLPLQVFFDDFFSGQTYALEVAFAAAQGLHEVAEDAEAPLVQHQFFRVLMQEMLDKFLTRNVKKMVGYAVSQSKLYGLKTERYANLKKVVLTVEGMLEMRGALGIVSENLTLADTKTVCEGLLAFEHVKETTLKNARGGLEDAPALDICGKSYPMTNKWSTVLHSLKTTLDKYGSRVHEFEGEGVDWKALSHAIRITEQVLELGFEGKLTFPRPNAKFLLAVKNGELPLDEATAYLNEAFAKVDEAVSASVLQEKTPELEAQFRKWKLEKLYAIYGL